jgi:hypothetical protein
MERRPFISAVSIRANSVQVKEPLRSTIRCVGFCGNFKFPLNGSLRCSKLTQRKKKGRNVGLAGEKNALLSTGIHWISHPTNWQSYHWLGAHRHRAEKRGFGGVVHLNFPQSGGSSHSFAAASGSTRRWSHTGMCEAAPKPRVSFRLPT